MSDEQLQQSEAPSLDEDLVAYLDGELDDSTSRRLEERLAGDASARERLRSLATSWDLLDHLPRASLDEAFTRTTVALVVSEAREEIAAEQAAIPLRNRRRWIAAAVAGLAAAMVGFILVVVAWPDANERLLRDLQVVKNVERYEVLPAGEPIEFLRDLERQELFVADTTEEPVGESAAGGIDTKDELAARRAEVEALPPEKKSHLRKLYERFQEKPQSERDRLRELDATIRSEDDASRLMAALESYHNWLPTLAPLERAKLLAMGRAEAIKGIEGLQKKQKEHLRGFARTVKSGQGPLSPTDVQTIEDWLQERASKRKDEILSKARPEDIAWYDKQPDKKKKWALLMLAWEPGPPKISTEEWKELLGKLPKPISDLLAKAGTGKVDAKDPALTSLSKAVKEDVIAQINKADTVAKEQELLFRWHGAGIRARSALAGAVSQSELKRFFLEELDEDERIDLAQRAPDDYQQKLRVLYFVKKEAPPGFSRGPWRKGWGRGGRGRGPDGEGPRFFDGRRGGSPPDFESGHGGPPGDRDRRRPHPEDAQPPRSPAKDSGGAPDNEPLQGD